MIRKFRMKRKTVLIGFFIILIISGLITVYRILSNPIGGKLVTTNPIIRSKHIGSVYRTGLVNVKSNSRRLRFVCFSDNHRRYLPSHRFPRQGDVLIFSGDFTKHGSPEDIKKFNDWMQTLPYRLKLVIAGNHDFSPEKKRIYDNEEFERMLPCCTFMDGKSIRIPEFSSGDDGVVVTGSSLSRNLYEFLVILHPNWESYDNSYYFNDEETLKQKLVQVIPNDTNILFTHIPPFEVRDLGTVGKNVGSKSLRYLIENVYEKIDVHIFGHIHQHPGYKFQDIHHDKSDTRRTVLYINSAMENSIQEDDQIAFTFDYFY